MHRASRRTLSKPSPAKDDTPTVVRAPLLRPPTLVALAYIAVSSLATSYSLQIGAISEFRSVVGALLR